MCHGFIAQGFNASALGSGFVQDALPVPQRQIIHFALCERREDVQARIFLHVLISVPTSLTCFNISEVQFDTLRHRDRGHASELHPIVIFIQDLTLALHAGHGTIKRFFDAVALALYYPKPFCFTPFRRRHRLPPGNLKAPDNMPRVLRGLCRLACECRDQRPPFRP